MKALNIQQPWASLICLGIKDTENRTWKPRVNPGRILIVASSKKVTRNFINEIPEDMYLEITLGQATGVLPEDLRELPTSVIVGYADIIAFNEEHDSCWGYTGDGNVNWKLTNAHLFKEPIPFPKGKLNIYDIPEVDENNLPETVEVPKIHLEGTALHIPLSQANMDMFRGQENPYITLFITDFIEQLLLQSDSDGNMTPKEVTSVILEGKQTGDIISFDVKQSFIQDVLNDAGEVIKFPDWRGVEMLEQQICYLSQPLEEPGEQTEEKVNDDSLKEDKQANEKPFVDNTRESESEANKVSETPEFITIYGDAKLSDGHENTFALSLKPDEYKELADKVKEIMLYELSDDSDKVQLYDNLNELGMSWLLEQYFPSLAEEAFMYAFNSFFGEDEADPNVTLTYDFNSWQFVD